MGLDRRNKAYIDQEIDKEFSKIRGSVVATLALAATVAVGRSVYVTETDCVYVRLVSGLCLLLTSEAPEDGGAVLDRYAATPLGQMVYVPEFDTMYVKLATGLKPMIVSDALPSTGSTSQVANAFPYVFPLTLT